MPFSRAKPTSDLYDAVRDHDLVLVPDAPLASAISRHLDEPHLGAFATTPRRLAAGRRERAEDRVAFLDLVSRLDHDWTTIAHAIGNVLQCWEHQGSHDAILDYDAHVTPATRDVVATMGDLETTSSRLTDYQIDPDRDVAVIGDRQLTPLERTILPEDYTAVDPFTDATFDYPPVRIHGSKTAVVDELLDAVTPDNADQVAVVLDRDSAYSPLVESALEANDIPFYGGPGFVDDPDHRAFLALLRLLQAGANTRVRDVRPLLTRLGDAPARDHDDKRLASVESGATAWVRDLRDATPHTFAAVLDALEARIGRDLDEFRDELAQLGIEADRVTEAAVDRLAFYLRTYEVPVERENEGVLLADATSAAYVGRPTVVHLGLDDGWTRAPPDRPWVAREDQFERDRLDFQLLLQSGRRQHYLAVGAEGGAPVAPTAFFGELLDEPVARFDDLDHIEVTRPAGRATSGSDDGETAGFDRDPALVDVEPTQVETLSQTTLAAHVASPRDYMFSRLLDEPDRDYFVEGTLCHDFAEFCVAHPEFVEDDAVLTEVVDLLLAETEPFRRDLDEPVARTEYRVAVETIRQFVREREVGGDPSLKGRSPQDDNAFAAHFDRPIAVPHTEREFADTDLGLHGIIDLVATPTWLVDHKSGQNKKSAREVVKHAAIDPPSDRPDFQAAAYLAHWRARHPDRSYEFTFFYVLATLDDAVAGAVDLEDALTTVEYHPESFVAHAKSEATFERLREEGANNCRKTLGKVEYADWAAVFETADPPRTSDSDELIDSAFGAALTERMRDRVGEYKYVTSGCKQALRELGRTYGRTFFRSDLDAFEAFVADQRAALNRRLRGEERFPVAGPGEDVDDNRLNHPDLLLEGDR